MEKVRECAAQGQDSVILAGPPRLGYTKGLVDVYVFYQRE